MAKVYHLGKVTGLELSARSSVVPWFLGMWLVFALAAGLLLDQSVWVSIAAGLAAALLHYFYELWHNFGHALAARGVGHPMQGVQFYGPLAVSQYPLREENVAPKDHIRRALGGPFASLFLGLVIAAIAWVLRPTGYGTNPLPFWLAVLGAVENFLEFGLGALLPLGWTDGSTLLHWLSRRRNKHG